MISMKEAVVKAQEPGTTHDVQSGQNGVSETRYKTKLLEEFTDYTNVGSSIWGAWVCPF